MSTYLYGYSGARFTKAQFEQQPGWNRLHSELRRRFWALMVDCPHDLGFGNGWRSTAEQQWSNQNSGGTVAGNSYHEIGLAVDALNYMPAIGWANQYCGRYGLKHFADVNGERWHFQPVELPNSRRQYDPSVHVLGHWVLPNEQPASAYPDPDTIDIPPATLKRGSTNAVNVRWLQCILRIAIDGQFGPKTEEAVKAVQRNLGLIVDGIYGPRTEAALRAWRHSVGLPR